MCVFGVRVCEHVWAGKLVQGTKLKGFFVPTLPPGHLVTGAAGELRARDRGVGAGGQRGRKTVGSG